MWSLPRKRAKEIIAYVVKGLEPECKRKKNYTLREFIEKEYAPWRRANRKRAQEDIDRVKTHFEDGFGNLALSNILPLLVDRWRSKRVNSGIKPITVNRDIAVLKALLSKAEEWGIIPANPLSKFKPARVDSVAKVRYLDVNEETRLKNILLHRDEELKAARERGNEWKKERGYELLPDVRQFEYGDHMTPMIFLSLNTGLRRGELFGLQWSDVNFDLAVVTVRGDSAKSGKTRHLPLNIIALNVLQSWQKQSPCDGLVFSSRDGRQFDNVKKAWAGILEPAKIENFRWHDMRHHFAKVGDGWG